MYNKWVKKTLLIVILGFSLLLILLKFLDLVPAILGVKTNAGIRVLSAPDGADVYIDSQNVGRTPYQNDDLEAKGLEIKIQSEVGSWEGKVKLIGHTITFINRSLAQDAVASSGETLTLEKGSGASVISLPSGGSVEIDGEKKGQTPGIFNVASGEHTFIISHEGFLNRSIKATIPEGFRLNLVVDLATTELETPVSTIPSPSPKSSAPTVVVSSTPTGFLRVRDKASISGKELAQVKPGEELELIEELAGWDKVKLISGTVGFVSNQYVTRKP